MIGRERTLHITAWAGVAACSGVFAAIAAVGGAAVVGVAVGMGAGAGVGLVGAGAFGAFIGVVVSAGAFKPSPIIVGCAGLAIAGGVVYALHAEPAEAARKPSLPVHAATVENYVEPLAIAFEGAGRNPLELRSTKHSGPSGTPTPRYQMPAP